MQFDTKSIAFVLGCKKDVAAQVYRLITGSISPEALPGTKQWLNSCGYNPKNYEAKLYAINEVLNGDGVESIDTFKNGYVIYCDTGKSVTVMYLHKKHAFVVGSLYNYIDV